jgi:DNA polymerase sigma
MKNLKTLLIALFAVLTINVSAQDSVKVTMTGPTDMTFKTNYNKNTEYERTLRWINKSYQNPDKVIKGKADGDFVTINGFTPGVMSWKSAGMMYYYDINYHIQMTFKDSSVTYSMVIDRFSLSTAPGSNSFACSYFYKKDGTPKEGYNELKTQLESNLTKLFQSYMTELTTNSYTSDEAITELKRFKDKLDLGLITQEDYNKKKDELVKFIK